MRPWHEPRPISELPEDYNDEVKPGDTILVYNTCDGWNSIWLMSYPLERIAIDGRDGIFTHWMPEPPRPLH